MAGSTRNSTFNKDGDGDQFNAAEGGRLNANTGDGNQFSGTFVLGDMIFGPRSSELTPQERCLQELAFPEMEVRSKNVDAATPGTCEWLLRHVEYKSWEQGSRGLLWVKGKPGSGKSTLLRHVLNAGKGWDNAIVLSFFFHGRGAELQRTPLGLFRSLLHQILSQAPAALSDLVDTFTRDDRAKRKPGEQWVWHLADLQRFFHSSIPKVLENRSVWLFVDALDESSNHVEIIEGFQSLLGELQSTSSQFHIWLSCRHDVNLENSGEFKICLEYENEEDISTYVQSRLSRSSTSSELKGSGIPKIIIKEARGLFMWARLTMETVLQFDREGKGLREIEKEVRSTPPDLHYIYQKLVEQMNEREASLKLMQWACFSERPLSLDELRWALVIHATPPPRTLKECETMDDWISNAERMKRRVQVLSRGLIEVITSSNEQVIQFIHQTVKDYFINEGISILGQSSIPEALKDKIEGHAHYQLSRVCIRYLAMEEIGRSICHWQDDTTSEFPFLRYATTSWVAHTKQSETKSIPQDDFLDYFGWPSEELVKRWVLIYQKLDQNSGHCPPEDTSMIHLVSRYQLIGPLRMILRTGSGIDEKDGLSRTPLSWAAVNGHQAVVKLLLGREKVDVSTRDNRWAWAPFIWAAENGKEAMINLLLGTGKVNVDAEDNYGRTPLFQAAANGHEAVVELLLGTGKVDINRNCTYGHTPLSKAAEYGHEAAVKLLLGTGKVNVNTTAKLGQTPLYLVASNGNKTVVKLLLGTSKINIDTKDIYGHTPLFWAAANGHEAVVELLLGIGKVNIDTNDMFGQTPLFGAATYGHEAIVTLLIGTGKVNVDVKDNNSRTPLFGPARNGHEATAKLLLSTGKVNVDTEDKNGQTPLFWAAQYGREAVVKLLLNTGKVNIDVKDNNGRTPLSKAAEYGHEAVVNLLLATGKVNVDAKDNDGRIPLFWAAARGHEAVVRLLLSISKVNVDTKDSDGSTPLFWATACGHEAVVKLLLDTGKVNIDSKDNNGQTPLLKAAEYGHEDIVKLLLGIGKVNIDAEDNNGQTPLSKAAENGHEDIVKLLSQRHGKM